MPNHENVLVLRAQQGHIEAFERLMALYEGPILYYILRQVDDVELARDLSQETWLAAWKSIRKAWPGSFRPWLYKIAHRNVLMEYRRRKIRPEKIGDPVNDASAFEAEADLSLQIQDLHFAIQRLSKPLLREVVILRYFAELTVKEIATAIDCPEGTVKSRLHFARRELERILNGESDHE